MHNILKEDTKVILQTNLKEAEQPLVSVIIPTFNRIPLLLEAIESVKAQTYSNWELIVVDDGSTDETVKTICQIEDSRIRVIHNPHTGNIGYLRNTGTLASKGEWLTFLDSDDLWLHKKLELQAQILCKEKRLWAYTGSELIDKTGNLINKQAGENQLYSGWIIKEILNTQTDFTISSLIVQKKLFTEMGGFSEDPKLFCREDHEFILRLALSSEASVVPEIMVKIRSHIGRTTNHLDDSFERSAEVYTTFLQYATDKTLRKIAKKRKAYHLGEASVQRFIKKDYKLGIKQLSRSFRNGNNKRHWLSAAKRCVYALIKKNTSGTAKKRKVEISNTYIA